MRDAFAFLSTLGRRGGRLHAGALRWFPLVGLMLGGGLGCVWWATDRLWPPLLAGALTVAADLAMTGALHVDGLADAADGLLPHAERTRRLDIMRDPGVGAFGVAVVAVALVVCTTALASRPPDIALLAGIWCAARAMVASVPRYVPYARDSGIASSLLDGAPGWPALFVVPAAGLAAVGAGVAGAAAVGAGTVAGAAVVMLAWRRLGGFTGDVLGATIVVSEAIALVVAGAKW
jgi:adenosylcobinamide-GDP ribazoletransferase